MKSTITNAAEISVLQPIDNNYKTGGGDISVGGCLVVAKKGKPFTPIAVYGGTSDLQENFGTPLPKKADCMEGLRHVHDAAEDCSYVQVVRVVSKDYRYPSLAFLIFKDDNEEWSSESKEYAINTVVTKDEAKYICIQAHTSSEENGPGAEGGAEYWADFNGPVECDAHAYNEEVTVGEGAFLLIYPVDGDASVNRSVQITNVDSEAKRFTITVYDLDETGEEYELESHTVGIDEDDKDDMGLSAYIETVFERDSERFLADFMEGITWEELEPVLKAIESTRAGAKNYTFTGGTAGSTPETQDFMTGTDVFRNERLPLNLLFAAGIYEPDVLVALAGIADDRHISFFYDVPPYLKSKEAMEWDADMGLTCRHARGYYSPYAANDQWRGGKTVWGVSGAMAAAKARCNATITVGSTPGVHYAPAGEKRAYLTRTGLKALFPEDAVNRDLLYDARINPVVSRATGGCVADDDLTHHFQTNYLRFGWINDVLDYIDHRFEEGARQVKFEPDGLTRTGLYDMTTQIMEELVTSGALVAPRDPERDGTSPYIVTVEQLEIDLWKVTWEICITGAARRIAGQPKLIR